MTPHPIPRARKTADWPEKKNLILKALLFFAVLLLGGCASAPRHVLQSARLAVAHADYYGAEKLASEEFRQARDSLRRGEELLRHGDYQGAQLVLSQAELLANQSRAKAEMRKIALAEAQKNPTPPEPLPPPKIPVKTTPLPQPASKPKPAVEPPPSPPPSHVTVEANQTLWMIAARKDIYDDPLLWPLLYQGNRDQIKDPRQIFPGQILNVPREVSAGEREEAREKARNSDIFPETLWRSPKEKPRDGQD